MCCCVVLRCKTLMLNFNFHFNDHSERQKVELKLDIIFMDINTSKNLDVISKK